MDHELTLLVMSNYHDRTYIYVSGTTMNYFLDGRINRAEILFPGVACFLVAVFLGAAVHSSNAKDDEQKLSTSGTLFLQQMSALPLMLHSVEQH